MSTALLYGDPSPSLRWRAAVELDGAGEHDADVVAWREEIPRSDAVRTALHALAVADRPQAAGYALCRLAHLGHRGPEIAEAVEALFTHQQQDGSWSTSHHDGTSDGPRFITMQTVVALRGIAAAGFATDLRAERAYEWLLAIRLPDGSWPAGPKGDLGKDGGPTLPEKDYRRLPRGAGCRSATTGAVACLAEHPNRARSDAARAGIDHLLAREGREAANLGWEVARLTGYERALGQVTFHVTPDPTFLLHLAARSGVAPDDRRVRELLDWLEALRGPFGLWEHPSHPQLSRWLTFDLELSMRLARTGDWIGDESPAAFTPYQRGRRRW